MNTKSTSIIAALIVASAMFIIGILIGLIIGQRLNHQVSTPDSEVNNSLESNTENLSNNQNQVDPLSQTENSESSLDQADYKLVGDCFRETFGNDMTEDKCQLVKVTNGEEAVITEFRACMSPYPSITPECVHPYMKVFLRLDKDTDEYKIFKYGAEGGGRTFEVYTLDQTMKFEEELGISTTMLGAPEAEFSDKAECSDKQSPITWTDSCITNWNELTQEYKNTYERNSKFLTYDKKYNFKF
jgi:hypothetical protein